MKRLTTAITRITPAESHLIHPPRCSVHERLFNHRHSALSFCLAFHTFHLHGYKIYGTGITLANGRVHMKLFNKAKVSEVTFQRSPSTLWAEPRTESRPPKSQASAPSSCHPASHTINAQLKYIPVAIDLMPLVSDS